MPVPNDALPNNLALLEALKAAAENIGLVLEPRFVMGETGDSEHIEVDTDTLVDIYPADIETRTLSGTIKAPGYVVTTTDVIPATRWNPEDAEVNDEFTSRWIPDTVAAAIRCVVERRVNMHLMAVSEKALTE